jgi:hypothetical protein
MFVIKSSLISLAFLQIHFNAAFLSYTDRLSHVAGVDMLPDFVDYTIIQ